MLDIQRNFGHFIMISVIWKQPCMGILCAFQPLWIWVKRVDKRGGLGRVRWAFIVKSCIKVCASLLLETSLLALVLCLDVARRMRPLSLSSKLDYNTAFDRHTRHCLDIFIPFDFFGSSQTCWLLGFTFDSLFLKLIFQEKDLDRSQWMHL